MSVLIATKIFAFDLVFTPDRADVPYDSLGLIKTAKDVNIIIIYWSIAPPRNLRNITKNLKIEARSYK